MRFRVAHLLAAMTLIASLLTAGAYFILPEVGPMLGCGSWAFVFWSIYSRRNTFLI
jgi:hypothetical protein